MSRMRLDFLALRGYLKLSLEFPYKILSKKNLREPIRSIVIFLVKANNQAKLIKTRLMQ